MNLPEYLRNKKVLQSAAPIYRTLCTKCLQPSYGCYCQSIHPLVCDQINFVILIHPIEAKRRIATGRMSHLCLQDSHLIKGQNFTSDKLVNSLVEDDKYHSVLLYPGVHTLNISEVLKAEPEKIFVPQKKLRVFVIDGTWATARRMVRQSENLKFLPRICFTPTKPSNFRVRKQPEAHCYSTIEAIHQTIELLGMPTKSEDGLKSHDHLLEVFDSMVERQLTFIEEVRTDRRESTYRREGQLRIDTKSI